MRLFHFVSTTLAVIYKNSVTLFLCFIELYIGINLSVTTVKREFFFLIVSLTLVSYHQDLEGSLLCQKPPTFYLS